jgi:hypothetical protein
VISNYRDIYMDKYWKCSTINTDQDPLKIFIFLSKLHTSPPPLKKTHQIYKNLKIYLDLCQTNWKQSTYWKLSPMYLRIYYTSLKVPSGAPQFTAGFNVVNDVRSLVFWVVLCRQFVLLSFFFSSLCCLSFDLRLLNTS